MTRPKYLWYVTVGDEIGMTLSTAEAERWLSELLRKRTTKKLTVERVVEKGNG